MLLESKACFVLALGVQRISRGCCLAVNTYIYMIIDIDWSLVVVADIYVYKLIVVVCV